MRHVVQNCALAWAAFIWLLLISTAAAEDAPAAQTGVVRFAPTPDEAGVALRFRLPAGEFAWNATRIGRPTANLEAWDVTFPSPIVTPHEANNTVHCEYYRPLRPGKRPAVIVLHILGGDFPLSRAFCNCLAQHGVAALFVKMPYYGPRRPPGVNRRMVSHNPGETVEGMTQAILDIRRATAWLASREEVDDQQLGIFGISLGGITSSLAATAEPRLANVCTLLAGGDVGRVGWESPELADVREEWLAMGGTREQFMELLKQIDPVTYAESARGKRVLMLNASHDEVIPRECTESLWKALGQPEIHWYRGGHYTVIRHLPSALLRVSHFFAATDGLSAVRPVYRAAETATIDGKLDEPLWKAAEPILVDRPHGRAGVIAEQPPLVVRLAWDERYLYIGYEVRDTQLVALGTGKEVGPAGNRREAAVEYAPEKHLDLVEFFVSPGGSLTRFWEVHHAAGNQLNTHWCVVPSQQEWRKLVKPAYGDVHFDRERYIDDDGNARVARAVALLPADGGQPSTVNRPDDLDTGYTGEIRLPWVGLGAGDRKAAPGSELRLLAAVLNGNGGQARYWSSSELPSRMFHFSASRWPQYRLSSSHGK
jgi:dienelactone hydrolase